MSIQSIDGRLRRLAQKVNPPRVHTVFLWAGNRDDDDACEQALALYKRDHGIEDVPDSDLVVYILRWAS